MFKIQMILPNSAPKEGVERHAKTALTAVTAAGPDAIRKLCTLHSSARSPANVFLIIAITRVRNKLVASRAENAWSRSTMSSSLVAMFTIALTATRLVVLQASHVMYQCRNMYQGVTTISSSNAHWISRERVSSVPHLASHLYLVVTCALEHAADVIVRLLTTRQ
jgi:hypothetical protein